MALDWHETRGFWQANVEVATRKVRDYGATFRIYRRGTPPAYELHVWHGPAADRPDAGADENLLSPTPAQKFSTLGKAKSAANRFPINQPHFPYDAVVNGFGVQFRSDIDGDRYVIVDERDHDMTGWKIETSGTGGRKVHAFKRDVRWSCYDSGEFDCFGWGGAETREP